MKYHLSFFIRIHCLLHLFDYLNKTLHDEVSHKKVVAYILISNKLKALTITTIIYMKALDRIYNKNISLRINEPIYVDEKLIFNILLTLSEKIYMSFIAFTP